MDRTVQDRYNLHNRGRKSREKLYRKRGVCIEKKTGIKVTPHMLRHYFANTRRKAGWKLELISQALGHRHIETTMKYLNITEEELMEASDAFYSQHQSLYGVDHLL